MPRGRAGGRHGGYHGAHFHHGRHRSGGGRARTVFLGVPIATLREPTPPNCVDLSIIIMPIMGCCGNGASNASIIEAPLPHISREEFESEVKDPLLVTIGKLVSRRRLIYRFIFLGLLCLVIVGIILLATAEPSHFAEDSFEYIVDPRVPAGASMLGISFFLTVFSPIWMACAPALRIASTANDLLSAINKSSSSFSGKGIRFSLVETETRQMIIPPEEMTAAAAFNPSAAASAGTAGGPSTVDSSWAAPPVIRTVAGQSTKIYLLRVAYPADAPLPPAVAEAQMPAKTFVYPYTGVVMPMPPSPVPGLLPYVNSTAATHTIGTTLAAGSTVVPMQAMMAQGMVNQAMMAQNMQQMAQNMQQQMQAGGMFGMNSMMPMQQIPVAQPVNMGMVSLPMGPGSAPPGMAPQSIYTPGNVYNENPINTGAPQKVVF